MPRCRRNTGDPVDLSGASKTELRALIQAIGSRRLDWPPSGAALTAIGLGHLADSLAPLRALPTDAVTVLLDAVVAERNRPRPTIQLVWTGPEAHASTARDTAVVLAELFAGAQADVLVAGYAFDHGKDILDPLHRAMQQRNVSAALFLDIPRNNRTLSDTTHRALIIDKWLHNNWPFGPPYPALYYDPRTGAADAVASLHAKCVVVDERLTLIGSANFTDRGQTRNIEVGVLIEDGGFARQVALQWQGLVNQKLVQRIVP